MATAETYYVNLDSSAGGDGTTTATAGANRAFVSLNEAEAQLQQDLVTNDKIITIQCMSGTNTMDNTVVQFTGSTVDATRYFIITTHPDDDHAGVFDTSKYYLKHDGTGSYIISLTHSSRLIGLQIEQASTRGNYSYGAYFQAFSGTVPYYVERCLFKDTTSNAIAKAGIGIFGGAIPLRIQNCLFEDFDVTQSGDIKSSGIMIRDGDYTHPAGYIQHNTFYNCAYGFYSSRSNASSDLSAIDLQNNLFDVLDSAVRDESTNGWGSNTDYNVVTVANGTGAEALSGSNNKFSQTITYDDAANGDYHSTDSDLDVSNNLYSNANYATTEDVDEEARPSSGDVQAGFDDEAASGNINNVFSNDIHGQVAGGFVR